MVLSGILVIPIFYYLGEIIGDSFIGISSALMASISPILIFLSSQIWNPNIVPLFVILSFLVLAKIYVNKKINYLNYFFLGILLMINVDLEIVFGLLFLIGTLLSIAIIKKNEAISKKSILPFLAGALIIISPRILFDFRNQFLMTNSFVNYFSSENGKSAIIAFETFKERTTIIFNYFAAVITGDNKILALVILIGLGILISLFYKRLQSVVQYFIITSITITLTFIIGLSVVIRDIWPHYFVGLPIVFILFFSIGLYVFYRHVNKFFAVIILLSVIVYNLSTIPITPNFTWDGGPSLYRNQLSVIDYVYSEAEGKKFKYVLYTPPVHDNTYKYLFRWYGEKKYGYKPSEIADKAFFILEPDPGYEGRLTDWLEIRQVDGKIIKEKEIIGGVIVQTRITK